MLRMVSFGSCFTLMAGAAIGLCLGWLMAQAATEKPSMMGPMLGKAVESDRAHEQAQMACCGADTVKQFSNRAGDWLRRATKGTHLNRTKGYSYTGYLDWLKYLANAGHPVSCLLDIGANKGEYTQELVGIFPEANVYSFEAQSKTAEVLTASWKANPRVQIFNNAVSDQTHQVDIYDSSDQAGNTGAGIGKSTAHGDVFIGKVQAYTLDDFFNTHATSCQKNMIVKVDVEGFDYKAMLGMKNLLSDGRIDALQLEYNPRKWCASASTGAAFPNPEACLEAERSGSPEGLMQSIVKFLGSLDYEVYLIGHPFIPMNGTMFRPSVLGTGDILALPMKQFWAQTMHCKLTNCCHNCYEGKMLRHFCFHSQCKK